MSTELRTSAFRSTAQRALEELAKELFRAPPDNQDRVLDRASRALIERVSNVILRGPGSRFSVYFHTLQWTMHKPVVLAARNNLGLDVSAEESFSELLLKCGQLIEMPPVLIDRVDGVFVHQRLLTPGLVVVRFHKRKNMPLVRSIAHAGLGDLVGSFWSKPGRAMLIGHPCTMGCLEELVRVQVALSKKETER